jgi:hypothetical protein
LLESIGYNGLFFLNNRLMPLARLEELRSTIDAPFLNHIFQPSDRAAVLPMAI